MSHLKEGESIDNQGTAVRDLYREIFETEGIISDFSYDIPYIFAQKQIERFSGKILLYTIRDAYGHSIVEQGTMLTKEIIELIKGKGKLIELIMQTC